MSEVKTTGVRVEFYQDVKGHWRWTQYAKNGKIRAASTEGFTDKQTAYNNWYMGAHEGVRIYSTEDQNVLVRAKTGERKAWGE